MRLRTGPANCPASPSSGSWNLVASTMMGPKALSIIGDVAAIPLTYLIWTSKLPSAGSWRNQTRRHFRSSRGRSRDDFQPTQCQMRRLERARLLSRPARRCIAPTAQRVRLRDAA